MYKSLILLIAALGAQICAVAADTQSIEAQESIVFPAASEEITTFCRTALTNAGLDPERYTICMSREIGGVFEIADPRTIVMHPGYYKYIQHKDPEVAQKYTLYYTFLLLSNVGLLEQEQNAVEADCALTKPENLRTYATLLAVDDADFDAWCAEQKECALARQKVSYADEFAVARATNALLEAVVKKFAQEHVLYKKAVKEGENNHRMQHDDPERVANFLKVRQALLIKYAQTEDVDQLIAWLQQNPLFDAMLYHCIDATNPMPNERAAKLSEALNAAQA